MTTEVFPATDLRQDLGLLGLALVDPDTGQIIREIPWQPGQPPERLAYTPKADLPLALIVHNPTAAARAYSLAWGLLDPETGQVLQEDVLAVNGTTFSIPGGDARTWGFMFTLDGTNVALIFALVDRETGATCDLAGIQLVSPPGLLDQLMPVLGIAMLGFIVPVLTRGFHREG